MESTRKKLILVDDDITNLTIGKNILSTHYDVFTVPSGEKLFKILEKITPDLVLLDIEMPLKNGYEVLKELKSGPPAIADIPVIFLTARSDSASELEGLAMGAADYFSKPFSPPLLLKRVELHLLVQEQKRELQEYRNKCGF